MSARASSSSLRALRLVSPNASARSTRRTVHSRAAAPSHAPSGALVCLAAGAGIAASLAISRQPVRADAPAPALAQPADSQIEVRRRSLRVAESAAGVVA